MQDMIRPQLWKIVQGQASIKSVETASTKDKSGSRSSSSSLIPISIRLIQNPIRIHEDILWDPNGPVSPMEFAQSLAKEFKLPEESAVSILTTMLEQLYGLPIDKSEDAMVGNKLETDKRGAWLTDARGKMDADQQVAAQHRS
ncbi:MAG: hypothetical protein SGILL_001151 [Bacillariaceae sp.]